MVLGCSPAQHLLLKNLMVLTKALTTGMMIINGSFWFFLFSVPAIMDFPSFWSYCSNPDLQVEPKSRIITILALINFLIWILITIYHDISLLRFVKQKESRDQGPRVRNNMIPWKSLGHNNSTDIEVPIKATTISSVSLISLVLLAIYIGKETFSVDGNAWIGTTVMTIWMALYFPTALLLIINHNSKLKASIKNKKQPPKGLQFHAESRGLQFHESDSKGSRNGIDTPNSFADESVEGGSTSIIKTNDGSHSTYTKKEPPKAFQFHAAKDVEPRNIHSHESESDSLRNHIGSPNGFLNITVEGDSTSGKKKSQSYHWNKENSKKIFVTEQSGNFSFQKSKNATHKKSTEMTIISE